MMIPRIRVVTKARKSKEVQTPCVTGAESEAKERKHGGRVSPFVGRQRLGGIEDCLRETAQTQEARMQRVDLRQAFYAY